ncbi:hypothetical protein K491DRAFT_726459 [Lophiostoma macrostomum CBS 122681]|uniref:Uncharacterized protein n=1 Tax=Lophiostoma macrostomum CBS 122681 TaxID=1314788 RepID=A0A6A6T195_9PLEO|nr:hypothetical protein K491DRAFT_726459 [Lophiostoma macrostomum CBS 122681]
MGSQPVDLRELQASLENASAQIRALTANPITEQNNANFKTLSDINNALENIEKHMKETKDELMGIRRAVTQFSKAIIADAARKHNDYAFKKNQKASWTSPLVPFHSVGTNGMIPAFLIVWKMRST